MKLSIRLDDLTDPRIAAFLAEHLRDMHATSPPESVHALDLTALKQPNICFWSGWHQDELLATGALKRLDATHAEVKSMRTAAAARGRGIGAQMLQHIMDEARAMGLSRLSLETGSMAYFYPAHALYRKHGFQLCGPFADYVEDPNSVFMTRLL